MSYDSYLYLMLQQQLCQLHRRRIIQPAKMIAEQQYPTGPTQLAYLKCLVGCGKVYHPDTGTRFW